MLKSLELSNFRCITRWALEFEPRCTLILGPNGSGKTSLLEAIHVLSCGRSFRTNRLENLINDQQPRFSIAGAINAVVPSRVGLEVTRESKTIRVNGKDVRSFAAIAELLPAMVIEPGAHKLLEEGPGHRRRFIDWGVFHVEPQFVTQWRRYERALRNRNASLKANDPPAQVRAWDAELIDAGTRVSSLRLAYVEALGHFVAAATNALLGVSVHLEYMPGWTAGSSLESSIAQGWQRDLRYKSTSAGPHRAELEVKINGASSKDRVSRGQQKLLACALLLAQLQHRSSLAKEPACLLLDDPAAELDVDNLSRLLTFLGSVPAQLVVAALDSSGLQGLSNSRRFHVEQGEIVSMI